MSFLFTPAHFARTYTYLQYRSLIDNLLDEHKTTGPVQSPEMVHYTQLNAQRMNRLDKTTELNESLVTELKSLKEKWLWLVLTEGWCGDAAQNLPIIAKMAEVSPNIDLLLLLRDEHPQIMDTYLTNGTRSIPKLICLNATTLLEVGVWGPRPKQAHDLVLELKAQGVRHHDFIEKLHGWYAKDKTHHLQMEFVQLINEWKQSTKKATEK